MKIEGFPLRPGLSVDLDIEPFRVTGPGTRFVLGRAGGEDETLVFDPSSVHLFRGEVTGRAGSHVFLALAEGRSVGRIDLGPGDRRYRIAPSDAAGRALGRSRFSVFPTLGAPTLPPGVPLCGVEPAGEPPPPLPRRGPRSAENGSILITALKHLELAVETDHEFFVLFDDADAAATYLVQLYGAVSDIYMRDLDLRVELVFARVWDHPNDLANSGDPLSDFRTFWNSNMGGVQRDAAQLLSGRRDYPFGGQAYVRALCGTSAYSVVGYAQGAFPDPATPSPHHFDVDVTSHELGHNSGTYHSHDYGIDLCHDPTNPLAMPQRGTIMSYCGQTWSGMNANRDRYFHADVQDVVDGYVAGAACIIDDCNLNGLPDAGDIGGGGSADVNGNGIPDECEDCTWGRASMPMETTSPTSARRTATRTGPRTTRRSRRTCTSTSTGTPSSTPARTATATAPSTGRRSVARTTSGSPAVWAPSRFASFTVSPASLRGRPAAPAASSSTRGRT